MSLSPPSNTIVGSSSVMASLFEALNRAARYDKIVLLLGETGTGKDLAARKIHELSPRRAHPFVAINCSNLPDGLFESELFGYAKGAFTGAVSEKSGLLEIAESGTVFLDEIGELPLHLQSKLLRLLDKMESRKLGATRTKTIRARLVFATNRDLYGRVLEGGFRKDLYYRLSVVKILIPALRDRKEDIPALIEHFMALENIRNGTHLAVAPNALKKLMDHNYPGNVRELENIIQRSSIFSEGNLIRAEDIRFDGDASLRAGRPTPDEIVRILEQCHWNKTRAASRLGKSRRQFYRILEQYQMGGYIRRLPAECRSSNCRRGDGSRRSAPIR